MQTCEHTGYGYNYYTADNVNVYYCAQCSQEETNKTYESIVDSENPQNILCVQLCPTTFRTFNHQTENVGLLKSGEDYCVECGSSPSDLLLYDPKKHDGNIQCVETCERTRYGYDYFLHDGARVYYCQLCSQSAEHQFFAADVNESEPNNTLCISTCETTHRSYYEVVYSEDDVEKYCKNCDFDSKHALATEPDGKSNTLCVQKCDASGTVPVSIRKYETYNGEMYHLCL